MMSHASFVVLACLLCSGIVTGLEVRLAGNGTYRSGRVEIRRSPGEAWGTVCDDHWSDVNKPDHGKRNADVVCRMLGFLSAERAVISAGFGQGTGTWYLNNVKCTGSETNLLDCPSLGWGQTSGCSHGEDVGVVCRGTNIEEVRLAGGTHRSGRIEVKTRIRDAWETLCDRYWERSDADVVCRMLGFRFSKAVTNGGSSVSLGFGQGSGDIFPAMFRCGGFATHLDNCSDSSSRTQLCTHKEDLGVECSGTNIREIRLAGGTHRSGRIEVKTRTRNVWGTLCDSHWERSDADVVCKMLGFRFSKAITNGGSSVSLGFGHGSGDILPMTLKCGGFETHLNNCSHSRSGTQSCTHKEDLGVECSGLEVRLADGTDRSGRVEIRRNNKEGWGTVCNDNWDVRHYGQQNADVVCRMLGFSSGEKAVMTLQFGQGIGPIILNSVRCNGTESDLIDCPSILGMDVGMRGCDHSEDVGVICRDTKTLTCPENQVALTSPGTGLATFQLKIGQLNQIFRFPMGLHSHTIKSANKTCNITLLAADYRVRNTLEFVADYNVDCSVVNSTVTRKLLEDVANQRYTIIEDLCDSVCKKPGHDARPVLSCDGKNDLQIRWPTDLVFTADSVRAPANITQTLESRIRTKGLTLDVVVFGASPPIVYPMKASNGGYVSISLSTTCISGLTYSDIEKKCV